MRARRSVRVVDAELHEGDEGDPEHVRAKLGQAHGLGGAPWTLCSCAATL